MRILDVLFNFLFQYITVYFSEHQRNPKPSHEKKEEIWLSPVTKTRTPTEECSIELLMDLSIQNS